MRVKIAICPRCGKATNNYEGSEYKGHSRIDKYYCENCQKYFFVEVPL